MESKRKHESLRFKFLKELDSILRFPTQTKTRHTNSVEPNKFNRMASAVKPHPPTPSSILTTTVQIGQSQPSTSAGTSRSTTVTVHKTPRSVPVQAVNKSVQLKSPQPSPQATQTVPSSSRPFTPNPASHAQLRQQRARRTERVKSIKRRPLQHRSSSLFYLEIGEQSPRRDSSETEQFRNRREAQSSQRSVSVDDLLDIGIPQSVESSLFFQPPQTQVPPLYSVPQITNASSDLLIFSPVSEVPLPEIESLSLNDSSPTSLHAGQSLEGRRLGRQSAVEVEVDVRPNVEILTDVQVENVERRQSDTPQTETSVASPSRMIPTDTSRPSSSRTNPTHSYFSTVSLDSILNHDQVRRELSRRMSVGTPAAFNGIASSQMSLPSTSTSVGSASTGSLMPKPSSTSVTGIDTLMSYDRTMDGLKVNEKIVWFTDKDVPQVGLIKWLGKINGKHMAGVEFENHVGNSSGRWNGRKLFSAALTKGRFVPITELLLYSDYSQKLPFNAPAKIDYPSWEKAQVSSEGTPVIICVICQDPLLLVSTEDESAPTGTEEHVEQGEKNMVTTHCGHLFHHECLTKWFNTKKKQVQPCPYCQRAMQIQDVIRIYPVQSK